MTIEFTITNRKGVQFKCMIDDCDADLLQPKWTSRPDSRNDTVYLLRTTRKPRRGERLHRLVMERVLNRNLERNELVDHIDRNGLNNTRQNLRLATPSENMANSRVAKRNKLGVKGVYKLGNRYRAQITVNRERLDLGLFATPEEAHIAYLEAAKKYFGEFARGE